MSDDNIKAAGDHQRSQLEFEFVVTRNRFLKTIAKKLKNGLELHPVNPELWNKINRQIAYFQKQKTGLEIETCPTLLPTEIDIGEETSELPMLVKRFEDFNLKARSGLQPTFIPAAYSLYFPHKTSINHLKRFVTPDYLCVSSLASDLFPLGFVNHPVTPHEFMLVDVLGKGAFGHVYTVYETFTKSYMACKVVMDEDIWRFKLSNYILSELSTHCKVEHPNIITLICNFTFLKNVYIVTELAQERNLRDLVKARSNLRISEMKFFMKGLVKGLAYLESCEIIHRDIKLTNLLLAPKTCQIKIADFGMAIFSKTTQEVHKQICGTANYMPPEMVLSSGYGFKVDVWAAGCVFYSFFKGEPPFGRVPKETIYKNIREGNYEIPNIIDQDASTMIKYMLQYYKKDRPTASMLLKMKFINTRDIVSMLSEEIFDLPPVPSEEILIGDDDTLKK